MKEGTQFLQILGESSDLSDVMDIELDSEISLETSNPESDNSNAQTEGEIIDTEEDMEEEKEKMMAEQKKVEMAAKDQAEQQ